MKAPFPWFGGKRRIATQVWERLGDCQVYCEPFAGSLAVLLNRPHWHTGRVETVNDLDGFVANAWRAILHDPERTAAYADWPVNENDLHARHAWLVQHRASLASRLEGDPDWYDAKIAGWWLWGVACWIGSGFCSGQGPWQQVDGQLVHLGDAGRGVNRQLVHLSNAGQGVNRKRVHLSNAGQGANNGDGKEGLVAWLCALSHRLRRVRVCCGDWARVVTPSALAPAGGGATGILLDPPYGEDAQRSEVYSEDSFQVAAQVARWCVEQADPAWRIALCGYQGEHDWLEGHGWTVMGWTAQGGMQRAKDAPGNRERERVWFSPACVGVWEQLTLA